MKFQRWFVFRHVGNQVNFLYEVPNSSMFSFDAYVPTLYFTEAYAVVMAKRAGSLEGILGSGAMVGTVVLDTDSVVDCEQPTYKE
jgi:hypothetical protein